MSAYAAHVSTVADDVIVVEDLRRYFKVRIEGVGFSGKLKSLLHPSYKVVKALDGITFRIRRGECVGYIGLNGAGKSTTIKTLCGVLVPTSGRVIVNGIEPYRQRTLNARKIGLMMGQRTQLLWDLPVRESFLLMSKVYDLGPDVYRKNIELLSEWLGIKELWDTPVRMLSLGQRVRCDLALTFLHDPEIVYLDEPTIGLDVFARESIREFLKAMKKRGVTIFLASHDLDDLEAVAERVILLHRGKIVFDRTSLDLHEKLGGEKMSLEEMVKRFYRGGEMS